jgi:cytidylate kinase
MNIERNSNRCPQGKGQQEGRNWVMSVITISRGSYSYGMAIAEKVAQRLNYECIARDVLLEASKEFNIPELKLFRAIKDAPSILDRFTYGKQKYVAYIQAALLNHLKRDNAVYHGFAGHFFVRGVSHVLKVRILADLEARIKLVMERDGISRKQALRFIKGLDAERRKWSQGLYGIDTEDASLYDLVIHIRKITVDDAADIICDTVGLKQFQTTPESQQAMDDLALAAEAKAVLIGMAPDVEVSAQKGVVYVETGAPPSTELALTQDIKKALKAVPGIRETQVRVLTTALD